MSEATIPADMLALLETPWEQVPDLPEFVTFPEGAYKFKGTNLKYFDADPAADRSFGVMLTSELMTPLEYADPDADEVTEGSLLGLFYFGEQELVSKLKKDFAAIYTANGISNAVELLNNWDGLEFIAVLKPKESKKEKGTYFNQLVMVLTEAQYAELQQAEG